MDSQITAVHLRDKRKRQMSIQEVDGVDTPSHISGTELPLPAERPKKAAKFDLRAESAESSNSSGASTPQNALFDSVLTGVDPDFASDEDGPSDSLRPNTPESATFQYPALERLHLETTAPSMNDSQPGDQSDTPCGYQLPSRDRISTNELRPANMFEFRYHDYTIAEGRVLLEENEVEYSLNGKNGDTKFILDNITDGGTDSEPSDSGTESETSDIGAEDDTSDMSVDGNPADVTVEGNIADMSVDDNNSDISSVDDISDISTDEDDLWRGHLSLLLDPSEMKYTHTAYTNLYKLYEPLLTKEDLARMREAALWALTGREIACLPAFKIIAYSLGVRGLFEACRCFLMFASQHGWKLDRYSDSFWLRGHPDLNTRLELGGLTDWRIERDRKLKHTMPYFRALQMLRNNGQSEELWSICTILLNQLESPWAIQALLWRKFDRDEENWANLQKQALDLVYAFPVSELNVT